MTRDVSKGLLIAFSIVALPITAAIGSGIIIAQDDTWGRANVVFGGLGALIWWAGWFVVAIVISITRVKGEAKGDKTMGLWVGLLVGLVLIGSTALGYWWGWFG